MSKRIEFNLEFSYAALFNKDLKRLIYGINSLKKYRKNMSFSQRVEYIDLVLAAKKMQLISAIF